MLSYMSNTAMLPINLIFNCNTKKTNNKLRYNFYNNIIYLNLIFINYIIFKFYTVYQYKAVPKLKITIEIELNRSVTEKCSFSE